MACCGGASSVVIVGGDNTTVTGSGTVADPYVISGNLEVVLQAKDTNTVSLDLTGTGNTNDPFILSAVATVSVNDLTDVIDPVPPVLGDSLLFDGTKWVYAPPAAVAPGTVHAGAGLTGDGTLATPLKVKVSEALDTSVLGLYTYIDANGELRAQVPAAGSVAWSSITGKPTTFPPTRPLTADSIVNAVNPANNNVPGIHIFVSSAAPVGAIDGDIWFQI